MVIYRTIQKIVTDDPKLVKKSARWVLRLLDKGQKEERVRCYQQLKDLVTGDEAILKRIVTIDETMLSLYNPENKAQSRQWLPKGQPRLVKARTQESRKKN